MLSGIVSRPLLAREREVNEGRRGPIWESHNERRQMHDSPTFSQNMLRHTNVLLEDKSKKVTCSGDKDASRRDRATIDGLAMVSSFFI